MKITDPDVIKNGEKDLIDAVKDDLDLDAVKQILEKKIAATTLSAKGGKIVVHNNEIAFRMDFDLNLSGSLMFDRDGNYISEAGEEIDPQGDSQTSMEQDNVDLENVDLEEPDFDDSIESGAGEPAEDTYASETEDQNLDIDLDDDLKIELPDYDSDEEGDDAMADNLVDNDIDDILKESQDFWDKKKES